MQRVSDISAVHVVLLQVTQKQHKLSRIQASILCTRLSVDAVNLMRSPASVFESSIDIRVDEKIAFSAVASSSRFRRVS